MGIGPLRLHSIRKMKEVLMTMNPDLPQRQGLYDPSFEHDSCGVNFIANLKGHKSHKIVSSAIGALCHLQLGPFHAFVLILQLNNNIYMHNQLLKASQQLHDGDLP